MPVSPQAHAISELFLFVLLLSAIVLAVVAGLVLFIAWRYRRTTDDEPRPVFGQRWLEVVWTATPVLIVALLFGLTVVTMGSSDPAAAPGRAPDIRVVAHQWWWEIAYPAAGVVTANDLHVPAGRPQLLQLESADVIHDFWVPRLARKIDITPGRPVRLWLAADSAGTYLGTCAEYCGTEHAWMRLRVTAEPAAAFRQWLAAQQRPATGEGRGAGGERRANDETASRDTSPDAAARGETLFRSLTCVNCHAVRGTADTARVGPDLTHLASRPALAAERVANTPANLRDWLARPDVLKPGSYMPNLHLSDEQLSDLVAYLETLR